MSKPINVIVINPFEQTTTEVTISNSESINEFTKIMDCRVFDVVRLGTNVIMYVDDEGLLIDENRYFKLGDDPNAYAYAGISIVACDDNFGGTISFDRDMSTIEELVTWMPEGYSEEPYMEFFPMH